MKKLAAALLVLTSTTLAGADPIHLGFGAPTPTAGLPRVQVALVDEPAPVPAPMLAEASPAPRTIFGLPKNVGTGDRILRTVVGAALLGAGIYGLASDEHLSTTTSGVLMGVSAVPFATAATGYCPLYQALGIRHTF